MADQKLTELTTAASVVRADLLYLVQAGGSKKVTAGQFVSSMATSILVSAPAFTTSLGTAGQLAFDSSNVYVCVAANTWRRTALTTW
jgi:hypothetical protein